MQVVLVMFRADGERRSFSIVRDMTVVGRREDCDLRIPLGEVSRKHCRLIKDADAVRVEDLGSSNGTFHNGQRVREATLAPGDTVQVGPVTFMVQIDGVPSDDEMQPALPEAGAEASTGAAAEAPPDDFLGSDEPAPAGEVEAAPATDDLNFDAVSEKALNEGSGSELDFDFDEEPSSNDRPA